MQKSCENSRVREGSKRAALNRRSEDKINQREVACRSLSYLTAAQGFQKAAGISCQYFAAKTTKGSK